MPLTPEDVVRKTFDTARFKGYRADDVDAFLEEVVLELRRLHGIIDELRAGATTPGSTSGTTLLEIEQGQLDQVRRERADLVRELGRLQEQYDMLRSDHPAPAGRGQDAQGTGQGAVGG